MVRSSISRFSFLVCVISFWMASYSLWVFISNSLASDFFMESRFSPREDSRLFLSLRSSSTLLSLSSMDSRLFLRSSFSSPISLGYFSRPSLISLIRMSTLWSLRRFSMYSSMAVSFGRNVLPVFGGGEAYDDFFGFGRPCFSLFSADLHGLNSRFGPTRTRTRDRRIMSPLL